MVFALPDSTLPYLNVKSFLTWVLVRLLRHEKQLSLTRAVTFVSRVAKLPPDYLVISTTTSYFSFSPAVVCSSPGGSPV